MVTDRWDPARGGWDDVLDLQISNRDQSCAFCGSERPLFAHRLDPAAVQFRSSDKGYTLPSFWTVCAKCEDLVARGDDDGLLTRMRVTGAHASAEHQHLATALVTFRVSDLGPTALADDR